MSDKAFALTVTIAEIFRASLSYDNSLGWLNNRH